MPELQKYADFSVLARLMKNLMKLQSHEFQLGQNHFGLRAGKSEQDFVVHMIPVAIASG